MATKQKPQKRKNPAAAGAREEKPFPFLDPDYPIKPWVNPLTLQRFQTVSIRYKNGWIAAIVEAPDVQATAETQAEAERAVMQAFNRRKNPDEDEVLLGLAQAAKGEPRMKAADFLKELGYGLDGHRLKK
jgi:hypothetical protein